ncbi:ABC transporter ATP-binding protein, partial [Solirubrobacter sp. CPCC 204708]|nr:ABC transporter ATP-binding protein [Solirubrobacter deserti]
AISGDGMRFKAKLDVVESMGSEYYVYFETRDADVHSDQLDELEGLDTGQVVARLDAASAAEAGATLELTLDTSQIKLFDAESGRALGL